MQDRRCDSSHCSSGVASGIRSLKAETVSMTEKCSGLGQNLVLCQSAILNLRNGSVPTPAVAVCASCNQEFRVPMRLRSHQPRTSRNICKSSLTGTSAVLKRRVIPSSVAATSLGQEERTREFQNPSQQQPTLQSDGKWSLGLPTVNSLVFCRRATTRHR